MALYKFKILSIIIIIINSVQFRSVCQD